MLLAVREQGKLGGQKPGRSEGSWEAWPVTGAQASSLAILSFESQ